MGRGAVSRATRMQQRANKSGNPRRGNPFGQDYGVGGGLQTNCHLKLLVHKNKQYRIGYNLMENACIVDTIMYYPHTGSDDWWSVDRDSPIYDELCHRLIVTLNVEKAMKER